MAFLKKKDFTHIDECRNAFIRKNVSGSYCLDEQHNSAPNIIRYQNPIRPNVPL